MAGLVMIFSGLSNSSSSSKFEQNPPPTPLLRKRESNRNFKRLPAPEPMATIAKPPISSLDVFITRDYIEALVERGKFMHITTACLDISALNV